VKPSSLNHTACGKVNEIMAWLIPLRDIHHHHNQATKHTAKKYQTIWINAEIIPHNLSPVFPY
jgi:hypothetical protein